MKKIVFALTVASIGLMSFTSTPTTDVNTSEVVGSTFKLVNDTGSKVKISHRNGSVSLNNGGSTSLSCTSGNKISVDGSEKFSVSTDFCGKTIKLSNFM